MASDWTQLLQTLQARLKQPSQPQQQPPQPPSKPQPLWKKPLSGWVVQIATGGDTDKIKFETKVENFEDLRSNLTGWNFLRLGSLKVLYVTTRSNKKYMLLSNSKDVVPSAFGMWMIHGTKQTRDFSPELREIMSSSTLYNFALKSTKPWMLTQMLGGVGNPDETHVQALVQDEKVTFEQLELDAQNQVKGWEEFPLWDLLTWEHLVLREMHLVDDKTKTVFGAILVSDQTDLLNRNALLAEKTWQLGLKKFISPTRITSNDRLKTFILSFLRGGISSELSPDGFETWLNTGLADL
jgi:hypothetical protein